jgi:ubiquitin-like 1-activating enzyme E1 A
MADLTDPATVPPPSTNGTFPANDAAGQTLAAMVEADKISAGRSDPNNSDVVLTPTRR